MHVVFVVASTEQGMINVADVAADGNEGEKRKRTRNKRVSNAEECYSLSSMFFLPLIATITQGLVVFRSAADHALMSGLSGPSTRGTCQTPLACAYAHYGKFMLAAHPRPWGRFACKFVMFPIVPGGNEHG